MREHHLDDAIEAVQLAAVVALYAAAVWLLWRLLLVTWHGVWAVAETVRGWGT